MSSQGIEQLKKLLVYEITQIDEDIKINKSTYKNVQHEITNTP
jgi:hypothetical protein